jgi:regulatory protein
MTFEAALKRFQSWCAREERCVADIKLKAAAIGISPILVRRIVEHLRKDGYINELRFARAFCRGKFLNNHWGKNKIIAELRIRGIDSETIVNAMNEIEPDQYITIMKKLIASRASAEELKDFEIRMKTARFLIQKGYESDVVWKNLNINTEEEPFF